MEEKMERIIDFNDILNKMSDKERKAFFDKYMCETAPLKNPEGIVFTLKRQDDQNEIN